MNAVAAHRVRRRPLLVLVGALLGLSVLGGAAGMALGATAAMTTATRTLTPRPAAPGRLIPADRTAGALLDLFAGMVDDD